MKKLFIFTVVIILSIGSTTFARPHTNQSNLLKHIESRAGLHSARLKNQSTPATKNYTFLPPILSRSAWQLTEIGNKKVAGSNAYIKFDDDKGRVSGNGGCNGFGGTFEQKGAEIKISQLISTKMACLDGNRMKSEIDFFNNLQSATKYKYAHGRLQLLAGKTVVLEFRRKK